MEISTLERKDVMRMLRFLRDFFGNETVPSALLALAVVVLDDQLDCRNRNGQAFRLKDAWSVEARFPEPNHTSDVLPRGC